MNNKPEYWLHRLVMQMDRVADRLLLENLGMSYKRCQVLAVLQHCGTITQHELAVNLGHSDPAVSKMLIELSKDELITVKIDPKHARKRLVTLTAKGNELTAKGMAILNAHFNGVIQKAGIDASQYTELTKKLFDALISMS
jgi:DNA-binding MarR family transcriptional regulator